MKGLKNATLLAFGTEETRRDRGHYRICQIWILSVLKALVRCFLAAILFELWPLSALHPLSTQVIDPHSVYMRFWDLILASRLESDPISPVSLLLKNPSIFSKPAIDGGATIHSYVGLLEGEVEIQYLCSNPGLSIGISFL